MSTAEQKPADQQAAPAPVPGTPEYDAAMVAKAEGRMPQFAVKPEQKPEGEQQQPQAKPRPPWLPEKFKSEEELAKAYAELEKKQGQQPQQKPETPAEGEQQQPDPKVVAKEAATKAGLDWAALNSEYAEKGDLSPETRAKLAEKGFDQAAVDSYIAGQKAIAKQYDDAAHEAAGGEAQMQLLLKWAGANFTEQEATVFNEAVTSGNIPKMKLAMSGLRARYESAEGRTPTLVQGKSDAGSGPQPFGSLKEQSAAQRDPRYAKDPAYRKQVEDRIRVSTAY